MRKMSLIRGDIAEEIVHSFCKKGFSWFLEQKIILILLRIRIGYTFNYCYIFEILLKQNN